MQYMLRTEFSWRISWPPVFFATGVVSRTCGRLGGEEEIIVKWLWGRMNSEFIRVA